MTKTKPKNASDTRRLNSVKKEMASPRVAMSARNKAKAVRGRSR